MLKHYFIITIRSIFKDKGYSFVNILGLSIAIACCFLLIFWVKFELSFDKCFQESDRIYRVLQVENRPEGLYRSTWIRPNIASQLKETYPQIEGSTFLHPQELSFTVSDKEGDGIMAMWIEVIPDFLRMFEFEYVEGNPQTVVDNRGGIITEEAAKKFFGNESPIGKALVFGVSTRITIDAVIKLPQNTHMRFDLLSISERGYGPHYIMLKEGVKPTEQFKDELSKFLAEKTGKDDKRLILQPLEDIHLHSSKELMLDSVLDKYGDIKQIYLFSLAALLILIIAIINYINTSIARALNRMKEVGVRKVTGSTKQQLIQRFLFESFIISLVSVVISLFFVKLFFPEFSEIMGNQTAFSFDFSTIIIAILVCLIITVLSGGYAAFYLSSFKPTDVLRGGSKTGSKDNLRKALIGLQFFLSISILICTLIIYKQVNAIFNAETGVDRKNIIMLDTSLWYDVESFITIIKKENPNIIDATIASSPPYNSQFGYSGVSWEGSDEDEKNLSYTQIFCDHHYANTFGLQLIDGQFIPPGLSWWQNSEQDSYNIVINEAFKEMMGEDNPIGITVKYAWGMKGKIIGVVKDFNFKPLKEKISPLIMSFNPEASSKLYIKTTGKDKQATLDYILEKYKEMKPDYAKRPVMYSTVEEEYRNMYQSELRTAKILSVFSVISFVLSLLGVISMISFMIEKRAKEIAIRKINGASIKDISLMFIKDITKVALLASVVSVPICYLIMHNWLQGYVYRTSLSWWIFIIIPAFIILVTSIIIAIQVYLTARQNPVESLRSE